LSLKTKSSKSINSNEDKFDDRLHHLEQTTSKFCNEQFIVSLIESKVSTIRLKFSLELDFEKDKVNILTNRLDCSESKYDALLASYHIDVLDLKKDVSKAKERLADMEKITHEISVKLNMTEDIQSDTFKNMLGIYEELKDQGTKLDDIDVKVKTQTDYITKCENRVDMIAE